MTRMYSGFKFNVFSLVENRIVSSTWWSRHLTKHLSLRSDFVRNVFVLSGGSAFAQVISLLLIPIFSRLYTPEHFGILAFFTGISSLLRVVASGRYHLAIVLPKKDSDAVNLVFLGFLCSFCVSFLSFILFSPASTLLNFFVDMNVDKYLFLIPLDILISGFYFSLSYWCVRKRFFSLLSFESVGSAVAKGLLRLALYFVFFNEMGLIYSYLGFRLVSFLILLFGCLKKLPVKEVAFPRTFSLARKYIKFPTYSVLNSLVVSLSNQITALSLPRLFSVQSLGYYSQATSLLGAPLSLVSGSISKVFYQRISVKKFLPQSTEKFFKRILKRLTVFSVLLLLGSVVFVKPLAGLLLGPKWSAVGNYARILSFYYIINMVVSSFAGIPLAYQRQGTLLLLEVLKVLAYLVLIFVVGVSGNLELYLSLFTLVSSAFLLIKLFWYWKLVHYRQGLL